MRHILLTISLLLTSLSITANETADLSIILPEFGKFRNCENLIECKVDRDCSSIVGKKDRRNCRVCLLKNPFGGCIARGNDPVCESAKASQKAAYRAQEAASKLDCERLKTQPKVECEMRKAALKSSCEIKKASELERAMKLEEKDSGLIALSSTVDRLHPSIELINFVYSETAPEQQVEMIFHQYVRRQTAYLKVIRFFKPKRYLDNNELTGLLDEDPAEIISVSSITYVDLSYQLKVEDVVRAAIVGQSYRELGIDGVSSMNAFDPIILTTYVDDLVIERCERMNANDETFKCNDHVQLYE